jgi:3-(3-hydroxy-phenyl)propionate hydroxylase
MIAKLLGLYGFTVQVVEAGDELIDFPRGVGMDDETMRTFQAVGLVENVLPHTVPHQRLVFVDRKRRTLAEIAPPADEFGWPRRNGFVQPLADRVLLEGLDRFPGVDVAWSSRVVSFSQDDQGVQLQVEAPTGARTVRARYLVGADGGRSDVRKGLGFAFTGSTARREWLVIDLRDDPMGRPGAFVGADPRRPYACISIPHGIRRFEFMLHRGEGEKQANDDAFVARLLKPFVPNPQDVHIIRRRVYAHHSRIAERFRRGRVFLAGDAAHVMPVWQGQGYNSAIRDAFNLSWKLAARLRGLGGDRLLDSYELERRDHVAAMVNLSTLVGRVISVRNPLTAAVRDTFFRAVSRFPSAKNYIVQMRFKPMPTMEAGALTPVGSTSAPTPVGRILIQPRVATRAQAGIRLDDAIGPWFALIAWNNNPRAILDQDALDRLAVLGARLISARPLVQLPWDGAGEADDVLVVGDADGRLKQWFEQREESVLLVRPDRIVGGASGAQAASAMVRAFVAALGTDGAQLRTAAPEDARPPASGLVVPSA